MPLGWKLVIYFIISPALSAIVANTVAKIVIRNDLKKEFGIYSSSNYIGKK